MIHLDESYGVHLHFVVSSLHKAESIHHAKCLNLCRTLPFPLYNFSLYKLSGHLIS